MDEYMLLLSGSRVKPMTQDEVIACFASGKLKATDYIRQPGDAGWTQVKDVSWIQNPKPVALVTPLASPKQEATAKHFTSRLVDCPDCGHQMSINSKICPQCGSPNNYVHPEITRFIQEINNIPIKAEFSYSHAGSVLTCHVIQEQAGDALLRVLFGLSLVGLGGGCLLLLIVPMIGYLLIGASLLVSIFMLLLLGVDAISGTPSTPSINQLRIDFSVVPPAWQCNDPDFWDPVKKFFRL